MLSTYLHILVFCVCLIGLICDFIAALGFFGGFVLIDRGDSDGCAAILLSTIFLIITTPAFALGIWWAI